MQLFAHWFLLNTRIVIYYTPGQSKIAAGGLVYNYCFALGNKSGSFCEAVNREQSEQEGKFLFATLWFRCLVPFEHWGTKAEAFVRQ